MIHLAQPADMALLEELTSSVTCFGAQIFVDWQLLSQNPAMPYRFYWVGTAAVLEVSERGALLCGEVRQPQELLHFLSAMGVQNIACSHWSPPGWQTNPLHSMRFAQTLVPPVMPNGVESSPPPSKIVELLQLGEGSFPRCFQDAYYANLCARLNHGFAQAVGIYDGTTLASVALLHACTGQEAYIAGVCTHPHYQGRGYARQLVGWLCAHNAHRTVTLLCEPHLVGFYQPLGFVAVHTAVQACIQ